MIIIRTLYSDTFICLSQQSIKQNDCNISAMLHDKFGQLREQLSMCNDFDCSISVHLSILKSLHPAKLIVLGLRNIHFEMTCPETCQGSTFVIT